MTKYQRYKIIIQIHKFTIKIDTISINLLFECVKIVEFNFNSHVFLVMYQDVRFLNKEERRQFLISSVSERDWKREHRLELLIVSIFQMQVKFLKVCSPFCSTAGTVSKKILMGGHPEFLARRQEEYQRPLCDLWVTWSSYGVGPGESAYSGFGTINAGNGLQITITCKTKQWLSLSRQYRRVKSSMAWPTTRHPLPATRYPSPVTRLPATRHPPPATRHPSPAEKSCRVRKCWKA